MDFFWEKEEWAEGDPHLRSLKEAPFERSFPDLQPAKGLYVIRGPRQVGKTSWLKVLLRNFPDPKKAFYLSCENIRDHIELAELLKSLRGARNFLLFDEISFVDDWSRAVKHELDSGFDGTMVVTGSHAVDLRKGADRMPGRFGAGGEFHLLPMDFVEYLQIRRTAGWRELPLVETARRFFRSGGFPSAVGEAGDEGNVPKTSMETYRRWLSGDMQKLGKQEIYLREVLAQLALTASTPLSLQGLAKRTQIGSHHTALEYVSHLEDCFALRTLYAIDPDTSAFRIRKDKKFYFTDPLIYRLSLNWAGIPLPRNIEEVLAETRAHESLARRSSAAHQRFGYYSVAKKGEVDFFSPSGWAIESKWSPVAHNLSRLFLDSKIPEKIVWTHENYLSEWPESLRSASTL
jgi:predicted AAA+ superfamily ATPase